MPSALRVPPDGCVRRIVDDLQPRLAGDARHDMEALDHRGCRCFGVGNHRGRCPISSSRKRCTRFQISCCGRTSVRARRLSTRIPLPRSAGIRLPGVRVRRASSLAQVDRLRQSQRVSDGLAGVVGRHEPAGSWWAPRLGPWRFFHSRNRNCDARMLFFNVQQGSFALLSQIDSLQRDNSVTRSLSLVIGNEGFHGCTAVIQRGYRRHNERKDDSR